MIDAKTFQTQYNRLNPAQKQAVDTIEGPVMVIAGPGTGKTQVLTLRIANILRSTQVEPENILALTFTESGVVAMRDRLTSIIGPLSYRVGIFTFHGFANYLINSHPEVFTHLISSRLTTELEQIQILETIFTRLTLKHIKPIGDPTTYIKPALTAINDLKKENVDPADFAKTIDQITADFDTIPDLRHDKGAHKGKIKGQYKKLAKDLEKNAELALVYKNYQKHLRKHKLFDFNDLLLELIDQLEANPDFLLELQERFQYFLVDEHQDTNRSQNRIVELLASFHASPNVFSVGDQNQAIYRFQGASLTNFLRFRDLYPDTQIVSLTHNYRSTQVILDAAHSLIQQSPVDSKLPTHSLTSHSTIKSPKPLTISVLEDPDSELHYLAETLNQLSQTTDDLSQIAILGRDNRDLHQIASVLASHNIPHEIEAKQNILDDFYIQKFITTLKAADTLEGEWLQKFLYTHPDLNPVDIYNLVSTAKQNQTKLIDQLQTFNPGVDNPGVELDDPKSLQTAYQTLSTWHRQAHSLPLDEVFTIIFSQSHIRSEILSHPESTKLLDSFIVLYDQLRLLLEKDPQATLSTFLTHLDLITTHNLSISTRPQNSLTPAVRLMTAHGSKGLEFDTVIIPRAYHGKWAGKRSYGARFDLPFEELGVTKLPESKHQKDADERRLFYVALTRAKQQIIITRPQTTLDGDSLSPSQFIEEIDPEHKQETTPKLKADHKLKTLTPNPKPNFDLDKLKSIVSEKFTKTGLSATALNNFLECPWKYFFRSLLRIPEARALPLVFGNAIHHTLHNYLLSLNSTPLTQKKVLTTFADYLKDQPLTKTELEELLYKGENVLPKFYQEQMTTWSKDHLSELNITGVGVEPDIRLTGKLDMLIPAGKPHHFQVVDFKTGKPDSKSRNWILGKTKASTGDYHRQLVFYQILMNRFRGGQMSMDTGTILFVEPTSSNKIKQETFTITSEQTDELLGTIKDTAEQIRTLAFWNDRCDDPDCPYCRLRDMMG